MLSSMCVICKMTMVSKACHVTNSLYAQGFTEARAGKNQKNGSELEVPVNIQ